MPSVQAQLLVDFGVLNINHLGDLPVALQAFDDAVLLRPNNFNYRMVRAHALLYLKEHERVEEEIKFLSGNRRWEDEFETPTAKIELLRQDLEASKNTPIDSGDSDS